jgi:hypothetical protein
MSGSSGIPCTVTNQLDTPLIVFNTTAVSAASNPPSTNAPDYDQVYTQIAVVPANGSLTFTSPPMPVRMVVAQQSNQFPILVWVPDLLARQASQTITANDLAIANTTYNFYLETMAQPYAPESLQITEIYLNATSPEELEDAVAAFFDANGMAGCSAAGLSAVAYWVNYTLYPWDGTYYCYEPGTQQTGNFVLPTVSVGTLTIANNTATYAPLNDIGVPAPLSYVNGVLSSPSATAIFGMQLSAIPRSLAWEGDPSQIVLCLSGTLNGQSFIAQPYEGPTIPWWVAAYDMAFGAFRLFQLVMILQLLM